jgi:hypothetical protein
MIYSPIRSVLGEVLRGTPGEGTVGSNDAMGWENGDAMGWPDSESQGFN